MSIRPGSRIESPRSMISPSAAVAADADDPVVLDADDAGPDDLAGVDVEQTRCFEGQHAQTTGSLMSWMYAAPLSSTRGCFHTSIGKLTMTIDCIRCTSALASSGIPLSGNRAST